MPANGASKVAVEEEEERWSLVSKVVCLVASTHWDRYIRMVRGTHTGMRKLFWTACETAGYGLLTKGARLVMPHESREVTMFHWWNLGQGTRPRLPCSARPPL